MSSIISLDHEIVQLPDTVGVLWVPQTSQRNWVTIKVHYGYLRKYLLSWHGSRLGFVTPTIGVTKPKIEIRQLNMYLWRHL